MPQKQTQETPVSNENAFKHLVGPKLIDNLALAISRHYKGFNSKSFVNLKKKLEFLEMKARVCLIRDALKEHLPEDYLTALGILVKTANDPNLKSFDFWPHTEFVQQFGLNDTAPSLEALKVLTQVFTSEWGVRPFLRLQRKQTLDFLLACASDENVHVRRWASEGTRPRLPWGERLNDFIKDPKHTLPILEKLKFDEELYVRKSVANHLNDIAKDNPDFVLSTLTRWKNEANGKHQEKIGWILARALRTLIKAGHPKALQLIGVQSKTKILFRKFSLEKKQLRLGDRLNFEFEVVSQSAKKQKLVIDYIVHFVKANGKTSPKVFKLKNCELDSKKTLAISKSHHIKKITTREFYAGVHALEIQINGVVQEKLTWKLSL